MTPDDSAPHVTPERLLEERRRIDDLAHRLVRAPPRRGRSVHPRGAAGADGGALRSHDSARDPLW